MARRMSDVLGISNEALESTGAFDAFVDIDSKFHIDPHLLQIASAPELSHSYRKFQDHFQEIVRILKASTQTDDRFWREACKRLTFREISYTGLGYSTRHTRGKGIGPKLAAEVTQTASEIIHAGILDPALFELIGLFEEHIGADRISDMTLSIILLDVLRYTERIGLQLDVKRKQFKVRKENIELPFDKSSQKPIILVPRIILRPLPIALDVSDIEAVASHNAELRDKLNKTIGSSWKEATSVQKKALKDAILSHPEVLEDLIEKYKSRPPIPYDFERDPEGEIIWAKVAEKCTQTYPLDIRKSSPYLKPDDAIAIVSTICNHFKKLVESNGLFHLFYDDSGKQKKERAAQLLFYGIADAYCRANDLNLTAESNAGRGPVDFKISKGYHLLINVEVKYTTNDIIHGFSKQLPIYNKAENATHSIFLIIRTTESVSRIKELLDLQKTVRDAGQKAPEIIIVDGRKQPSASKAKDSNLALF